MTKRLAFVQLAASAPTVLFYTAPGYRYFATIRMFHRRFSPRGIDDRGGEGGFVGWLVGWLVDRASYVVGKRGGFQWMH